MVYEDGGPDGRRSGWTEVRRNGGLDERISGGTDVRISGDTEIRRYGDTEQKKHRTNTKSYCFIRGTRHEQKQMTRSVDTSVSVSDTNAGLYMSDLDPPSCG